MSILDLAKWAGWNAGMGKRAPHLLSSELLLQIQEPHVDWPHNRTPAPEREYALGWVVEKFPWANHPTLWHTGSNNLNFAEILVDRTEDLGVVVMTNFPGLRGHAATEEVTKVLYLDYASN
jgi:hypothetical protein